MSHERRRGLNRCRCKGFDGMPRWVGLGIIARQRRQHPPRLGTVSRFIHYSEGVSDRGLKIGLREIFAFEQKR